MRLSSDVVDETQHPTGSMSVVSSIVHASPLPSFPALLGDFTGPLLAETRHLIGREAWLTDVQQMVQRFPAKKLIVVQGPIGVGKSSELMRLASAFQQTKDACYRVIWLPFPAPEGTGGPEAALDILLGTLLNECGLAPFPSEAPREARTAAFLSHLEKHDHPTVILVLSKAYVACFLKTVPLQSHISSICLHMN